MPATPDDQDAFVQHSVLVLGELEPVLIDRERSVELLEQGSGKCLFELADQRRIKSFKSGKIDAQLATITSKKQRAFNSVFFTFFYRALLLFDTSFCAVSATDQCRLTTSRALRDSTSLDPIPQTATAS